MFHIPTIRYLAALTENIEKLFFLVSENMGDHSPSTMMFECRDENSVQTGPFDPDLHTEIFVKEEEIKMEAEVKQEAYDENEGNSNYISKNDYQKFSGSDYMAN